MASDAAERILILGGAGFIGSNFAFHVADEFEDIYVVDKLTYAGRRGNIRALSDRVTFVQDDIQNRQTMDELFAEVEYVVNFAAQTHVDRSIDSGLPFVKSNVLGTVATMDLLRDHDIERYLQISTDEVYGSTRDGVFEEGDPLDPSSPYSASKASADLFVNAMWETYDLPIAVARPTNVYGPRQHPEKLIPKFTLNALEGESLPIYGDGKQVRQWLYVDDMCRATHLILTDGEETIYNVPGPSRHENIEVTERILSLTDASADLVEHVSDRKGHDQRYALDGTKIRDSLGFEPQVSFEEGLERTVEWYTSNKDRYR